MNYYDWMHNTQRCALCHWSGQGSAADLGDTFDSGAEYHCPSCGNQLGFVAYPLASDVLSDPRAEPADRAAVVAHQATVKRARQVALKSPDQLPELEPEPVSLTWDVIYGDKVEDDDFIVIRQGDREVWRELSLFEEYMRFGEIAALLWAKYGDTLRDLEPTEQSWLNLGGDSLGSVDYVRNIRESLGRGERPSADGRD